MRILACLAQEHDWRLVVLAAVICLIGAFVAVMLFKRTIEETGAARYHWCFLAAVAAGSVTWATHFIAMLGYRSLAPVSFDGPLTVVSAVIAVVGIGSGLMLATLPRRWIATLLGGGTIGLAIAAMHYVGMFAYRVDGIVHWDMPHVIGSVVLSVVLSAAMVNRLRASSAPRPDAAWGLFAAAIVTLHFTGMAAFSVTPLSGLPGQQNAEAFAAMASAIAMVAAIIVGAAISSYLVENRARFASQAELAHIAMHDKLTELANRHSFAEALEQECARLGDNDYGFGLLLIDLDRFKPVNDTLGHPMGDIILQKVAARLLLAARRTDLVARIGGDEFAVIARGGTSRIEIARIAARLVEILSRPFVVNGNVVELGGSVGFSMAPHDGTDAETLTQHADVALYTAKRGGRERFCQFEPELMEDLKRRRFLEADLRRACMREDFEVAYQPVIDPRSGRMISAEALLRWTCPKRGPISPAEFVPIAEELGLVSRIGAGVLMQACRDAATWPDDIDVAVNISPVQLLDPRLPQTVIQALTESGLPASRLELEITETALLGNDEAALKTLNQLRDLGIRISLDDFGTGYSSLSYLHRFPISRIKIDRSFVRQLPHDPSSASIVRAIAQLGESLDMQITAEGIETAEQLSFITDHGCDHVQGFLISHPIPATELKQWLEARTASADAATYAASHAADLAVDLTAGLAASGPGKSAGAAAA
jgi:diguanylate cyclase (GGDEF)-like protein